jgi:hypothetical protein
LHALGALQESVEKGPSIPSKPLCKNRPNPQMFLFSLAKWMFVCYDLFFMCLFCLFQEEQGRGEHFFSVFKNSKRSIEVHKKLTSANTLTVVSSLTQKLLQCLPWITHCQTFLL